MQTMDIGFLRSAGLNCWPTPAETQAAREVFTDVVARNIDTFDYRKGLLTDENLILMALTAVWRAGRLYEREQRRAEEWAN